MPKESTHLFLSQEAERHFSDKKLFPQISEIISLHPGLFYLGSVSPDTIFNYTKGPYKDFFKKNMSYSHDAQSHNIFAFLTEAANKNLPLEPALSFALGTISHFSADAIFHPLIFYFTGNVKKHGLAATIRHYSFETNLDKTLRRLHPWLKHFHLLEMDLFSEEEQLAIVGVLESLHIPPEKHGEAPACEFINMCKQHIKHEKYYGKLFFVILSRLLNFFSGGKKQDLKALFYIDSNKTPCNDEYDKIMNKKITFKNPETGNLEKSSISNLIDDYIRLFSENILPIEKALNEMVKDKKFDWNLFAAATKQIIPRSPTTGLISYPAVKTFNELDFFEIESFREVMKIV